MCDPEQRKVRTDRVEAHDLFVAGFVIRARGVVATAALADNDSYGFFAAEGGLWVTGPTRTNVMDLALVRVEPCR